MPQLSRDRRSSRLQVRDISHAYFTNTLYHVCLKHLLGQPTRDDQKVSLLQKINKCTRPKKEETYFKINKATLRTINCTF